MQDDLNIEDKNDIHKKSKLANPLATVASVTFKLYIAIPELNFLILFRKCFARTISAVNSSCRTRGGTGISGITTFPDRQERPN